MATIDELMEGKAPGSILLKQEHEIIFRPYFKSKSGEWYGIDSQGFQHSHKCRSDGWYLYEEPKPKRTIVLHEHWFKFTVPTSEIIFRWYEENGEPDGWKPTGVTRTIEVDG